MTRAASRQTPAISLDELRAGVADGSIATVELVLADLQGRLQGKRIGAHHFLDTVLTGGCEAQSYLLATDVEMAVLDGFELASWATGFGNMLMRPDLASMRRLPWHPRSVLVTADITDSDGRPIRVSPRQILRAQLDELAGAGLAGFAGTELEFQLFAGTYEQAWQTGYRALRPASDFGGDYSMLDTRGTGEFLDVVTEQLGAAGVGVESIVTEAGPGQHEIVLSYGPVLAAADDHAFTKFAVKQIAAAAGRSATFMAKLGDHEGNACHVHYSLRDDDGRPAMPGDGDHGFSPVMAAFLAGQLAYLPELTLLFAPNINSYKRFVDGSYAPTTVTWGYDNRSCALRVLGSAASLRFEHRLPGGDANMYLVLAAIVAAGLRGIKEQLELPAPLAGNAYAEPGLARVPMSLRGALEAFRSSRVAAEAFGDDVVRHLTRAAEVEIEAFDRSVTDWEKFRGFERL